MGLQRIISRRSHLIQLLIKGEWKLRSMFHGRLCSGVTSPLGSSSDREMNQSSYHAPTASVEAWLIVCLIGTLLGNTCSLTCAHNHTLKGEGWLKQTSYAIHTHDHTHTHRRTHTQWLIDQMDKHTHTSPTASCTPEIFLAVEKETIVSQKCQVEKIN